jgi:hypothetical protein
LNRFFGFSGRLSNRNLHILYFRRGFFESWARREILIFRKRFFEGRTKR